MLDAGAPRWGFATWTSDAPTGGNVYDRHLVAGLREHGVDVAEHRIDGAWPRSTAADRARLADLLTRERRWVVDGIVACGAPDVVAGAVAAGRPVVLVVHSFTSAEVFATRTELAAHARAERRALRAATAVVCTSHWSAAKVRRRCGRTDAVVAVPGVDPAPAAGGSAATGTPRLLSLGTVCERKDQLTLVAALAAVRDLPWTAGVVGADTVDPGYAGRVRDAVARAGLGGRVAVPGPRTGAALEAQWDAADLLVHTSHAETYGMVVAEARARGVPSVVAAGTGATEAQSAGAGPVVPGVVVPPGDPGALAAVLRRWLTDDATRRRWRQAALDGRAGLPGWERTAWTVADALVGVAVRRR